MYKYVLTLDAEEDITRIFEYGLYRFGIDQANKYYEMLFESFEKIAENPFLFPSASHVKHGFRRCVSGVDTIYYIVLNDRLVEINTIIGRQDFDIENLIR